VGYDEGCFFNKKTALKVTLALLLAMAIPTRNSMGLMPAEDLGVLRRAFCFQCCAGRLTIYFDFVNPFDI
jgi:hypothetical protein